MKYQHVGTDHPIRPISFGNEQEGTGRERTGQALTLRLQLDALTVQLTVLLMERKGRAAASAK